MAIFFSLFAGNFKIRLKETDDGLHGALQAWDDFDLLYDTLHKWLKETEAKVKDCELKSTIEDKRSQLEKFKVKARFHELTYLLWRSLFSPLVCFGAWNVCFCWFSKKKQNKKGITFSLVLLNGCSC